MSKRFVIPYSQLPARLPFWQSLTAWLMLDRFDCPGWLYGVVGTLFALIWIVLIAQMWAQELKPLPGYGQQKDRK
jgi:hypothetical protein